MLIFAMFVAVLLAVGAAYGGFVVASRRAHADGHTSASDTPEVVQAAIQAAVDQAVAEVHATAAAERDGVLQATLQQNAVLQREQIASATERHQAQLDAAAAQAKAQSVSELGAKKDVIDARLDQVHAEMRTELSRVTDMLQSMSQASAQKFGEVESSLRAHQEITNTLSESTQALRSALANPQARGAWGERMAEDVLRLAGFVENVNYVKQAQIEGATGRPDFTFHMPKGQSLFMDVKFPMAAYLRYLDAGTDQEREVAVKQFLGDVRARVRELAKREYAVAAGGSMLDNVLLFIPNEQITGFIHEHDPNLIDEAMGQQIVLCSPLTLFAFLGVIRQAHDNFMIEQTSDEILALIGKFGNEWVKYTEALGKLKRRFAGMEKDFDDLTGTRQRTLERPLAELDAIRRKRSLPVDGELFALEADEHDTPAAGNVRHLGA